MNNSVTVVEQTRIAASPEVVWGFTQDYARRVEWDASILEAEVIEEGPTRRVRIVGKGGLKCAFVYKLFDRPSRTTLAMVDVESPVLSGGGGSWTYEQDGAETVWTQTNTLTLRDGFFFAMLRPIVAWQLRRSTRQAMESAKRLMENVTSW